MSSARQNVGSETWLQTLLSIWGLQSDGLLIAGACFAEIGIGLTGVGFLFSFLGVIFFFDKGLLAMGNVRLLCSLRHNLGSEFRDSMSVLAKSFGETRINAHMLRVRCQTRSCGNRPKQSKVLDDHILTTRALDGLH